ncbi:glyoxylate reductase [Kosmotoga arenicorallina S304]|uniref:Glyoxylate reductase n=1 Tax=Kosmotoga arenicorallina S304 TaxID=1453497 RepID=A0A176JYP1_9BACT|nr:D-glycerate dehydrogenase [Kosmotoga arenicorallina]OAA29000.1 glyoxylate reductase [Kosmotoga arenicorallina S304]
MEKILVTFPAPSMAKILLKEYETVYNEEERVLSKDEIIELGKDATALLTTLVDKIDRDIIYSLPKLKVISNCAAGYDNIDIEAAKERRIAVTNTPGIVSKATADIAIALMLAVSRRIFEASSFLRAGKFEGWRFNLFQGLGLHRKILGIIGMGNIGKEVARRAIGFGMRVIYYSRHRIPEADEHVFSASYYPLEDLLRTADVISLHVPLTPETFHLINKERLMLLKPNAILINTSRGPVVDEEALIEALKEKRIYGAGLDVFENEPYIPEELMALDNVVLLPHIGTATVETRQTMLIDAIQNIVKVFAGEKPDSFVYLPE